MENIKLNSRDNKIGKTAGKVRRSGKVPGIVYGKGMQNFMFEIGELELNHVITEHGEHGVIDIDLNEQKKTVLIKELQRDPVTHKIIHLDLETIDKNQKIITTVPLHFKGEGILNSYGAIIQKEKSNIRVSCTPGNLPKYLELDVSQSSIGSTYKVSDIEVGKEISIIDDLNTVLGSVSYEHKIQEAVEPEERKE
ncbi:50S ribosomal protein L25 [Clostridium manihotivorum]|uniref:Large ribosomal subunit protein bL25 n=1 Tax=Clostridium manihotivorum TaxID=2320868 RepID=A0A3R5QTD0_9CLOT|nr:50S ribosomal protein L25 [Clostridium manihotivorum]QAA32009.1 50S ribosomal protein L25 [Clostridium manihotivorum]